MPSTWSRLSTDDTRAMGFHVETAPLASEATKQPMDTLLLQDWVTVTGYTDVNGNGTLLTQGADCWLDTGDYEDLVVFLQTTEVTGSVGINIQTAPSRQEASFVTMIGGNISASYAAQVVPLLLSYANVPTARFVRWQLANLGGNGVVWGMTFRLLLAAYSLT